MCAAAVDGVQGRRGARRCGRGRQPGGEGMTDKPINPVEAEGAVDTIDTPADGASVTAPASASDSAGDVPAWLAAERADAAASGNASPVPDASVVDPTPVPSPASSKPKASVADVEEAMKDVVDPELGINV